MEKEKYYEVTCPHCHESIIANDIDFLLQTMNIQERDERPRNEDK